MSALCTGPALAQDTRVSISGFVTDAATGERLIGATLFLPERRAGTVSNVYGFYSLTLPAGVTQLRVSYVGYRTRLLRLDLTEDGRIDIELTATPTTLGEVEVVADRADGVVDSPQMGAIDLPISEVEKLPVLLGEIDVIKTLQLLPGVQSGHEGSTALYVRGGGPDQNLILLDGAPVYNVSHVFGFLSVFNSDALNSVRLIKGGFPARYGGRLSSVVDLRMKEGNLREYTVDGSVGLVMSSMTVQGPLARDRMSFIVSARRTYIDILARPFLNSRLQSGEKLVSYFYDVNAKLNYAPTSRDRFYLSFYLGDDVYGSTLETTSGGGVGAPRNINRGGADWGNMTSTLRWNHILSNKLFANTTLVLSRYNFDVLTRLTQIDPGPPRTEQFEEITYSSGIDDISARVEFDYNPSLSHQVKFGAGIVRHDFNPGVGQLKLRLTEGAFSDTTITPNTFAFSGLEYFAFAEDDVRISGRLRANVGLHASGMRVNATSYASLQPRLGVRLLVTPTWSLKASFSTMQQHLHLLTNTGINLPTDLWLSATDRIPPQKAWQAGLGTSVSLGGGAYAFEIDTYYKRMSNLIEYKPGASFITPNEDWQDKVEIGRGWSYGAEFFLRKSGGRTSGWIGYTLAWSWRQFDALNEGRKFPYRYDRRHDVSFVLTHRLSRRLDVGLVWVYGTGQAITLATGRFFDARLLDPRYFTGSGTVLPELREYGARGGYRMRAYHRFDVALNWRLDKAFFSSAGESTVSVGVYNAYNRLNPFYLFTARGTSGERVYKQASLFPLLPFVAYRFTF